MLDEKLNPENNEIITNFDKIVKKNNVEKEENAPINISNNNTKTLSDHISEYYNIFIYFKIKKLFYFNFMK